MAAHRLWSLGCWSNLHPNKGHSSFFNWLQNSDPTFNMGVDVMRPAFNLEPKYRVTMFTRGLDLRLRTPSGNQRAHLVYRWV